MDMPLEDSLRAAGFRIIVPETVGDDFRALDCGACTINVRDMIINDPDLPLWLVQAMAMEVHILHVREDLN